MFAKSLNELVAHQLLSAPIPLLVATGGGGGSGGFSFPEDRLVVEALLDLWRVYVLDASNTWVPYHGSYANVNELAYERVALAVAQTDSETTLLRQGIVALPDHLSAPASARPVFVTNGGALSESPTYDPDFVNMQFGWYLNSQMLWVLPVRRFRLLDIQICINNQPEVCVFDIPVF